MPTLFGVRAVGMLATLVVAGALSAQSPTTVSFTVGPGTVPAGTTMVTYDAWDEDGPFASDDQVLSGEAGSLTENGGATTGNLPLICNDANEVSGGAGSSGETCAEIYVVFTFRDAAGNVLGTYQSGQKTVCCPTNTHE